MSCKFCDLPSAVERNGENVWGGYLVGEWAFTEDDDLTHHSYGRVNLWYDFEDDEWALLVLVADDRVPHTIPATVQLTPSVCPSCGRKLQTPKWLWRLEARDPKHGLWYDSDGEWVFDVYDYDCSTKSLPMGWDWRYQQDGKSWWSSCSDKSDLTHWYSIEDAKTLTDNGFVFTRYLATEYHEYRNETVFLKESCLKREELTLEDVFGEEADDA